MAYFTENTRISTSILLFGIILLILIGLFVDIKRRRRAKYQKQPTRAPSIIESDRNKLDEKEIQKLLDVNEEKQNDFEKDEKNPNAQSSPEEVHEENQKEAS